MEGQFLSGLDVLPLHLGVVSENFRCSGRVVRLFELENLDPEVGGLHSFDQVCQYRVN